MKLQRVLNRRVKGKIYWKWRIEIPPDVVDAMGWTKGDELVVEQLPEGLVLRPARE